MVINVDFNYEPSTKQNEQKAIEKVSDIIKQFETLLKAAKKDKKIGMKYIGIQLLLSIF